MTAYIRVLGGSLGLPQDFRGPMAKPQRMAAMTVACVIGAIEHASMQTQHALRIALIVITVGAVVTCVTRIRAMAAQLQQI